MVVFYQFLASKENRWVVFTAAQHFVVTLIESWLSSAVSLLGRLYIRTSTILLNSVFHMLAWVYLFLFLCSITRDPISTLFIHCQKQTEAHVCKRCTNGGSAVDVIQDLLILNWFLQSGLHLVEMGGRLIHHSETFFTSPGWLSCLSCPWLCCPFSLVIFFMCLEHQISKSDNETFYKTSIPPSNMYSFRIVWKKGFLAITVHYGALCRSMLWKHYQVALDSRARAHCDFMFAALFINVSISH